MEIRGIMAYLTHNQQKFEPIQPPEDIDALLGELKAAGYVAITDA